MSPPPPEKRPAEGELESERKKPMKVIPDFKDYLLLRAPDAGFDPATLSSLIDDFVLRSDGLDLDTHTWNQVKEKLDTFIQGMVNIFQNLTKMDPPPAAAVDEAIMNEDESHETEEPMRLLFSNSCEICVVDIKQPKGTPRSEVDYLRKIATLKLAEEQLPVSVGLFRLGSDAYMTGGQSFPTNIKAYVNAIYPNPFMRDAYNSFPRSHDVKGTSCDTYRLSIVNNGTLSASKCTNNILRLQSPKLWPVVAEIKGKVHVFDSFPSDFCSADPDWRFSHEVISDSKHLSLTIETPLYYFIKSHLVLGDHIFALTREHMRLLFNPIKLEWNLDNGRCCGSLSKGPRFFENVWDILCCGGEAMCVEEIMVGNDSYYLVLALLAEFRSYISLQYGPHDDDTVIVVAYLVTSKGDIVGRQTLHSFFKGPVKPLYVFEGAFIKGGGTDGKTMCIALTGRAGIKGIIQKNPLLFFFSNTFTVELLNNSDSNIKHILEADPKPLQEIAIDGKLVRIDIKDRCVYKINENDSRLTYPGSMKACFF